MPIQLSEEDGGKLLNVHVSGKLTSADYDHFVPEFERLVGLHGKLRVLFDMTGFHGWDAGALWEDSKFAIKHFADIERIAMVGETKWQHSMATFCKPFTKATIQYFDHAQLTEARAWLDKA
jgi:hypothetical protein